MSTTQDFSGYGGTWCPGCGDWAIGMAIKQAFVQLELTPSSLMVFFDIGCSGNMNDYLNAYAMHGLHGRSIPTALGAKLANHTLRAVVVGGDGGIYGEGGNHFLHACRGNHDITVIVHDNGVYGLTTGQVAPTADKGYRSKSTPAGIIEFPANPLALALSQGASFVAQSFAGDLPHVVETIKKGVSHKGFSLINILQPCVTFNKVNTYQYYLPKVYKLDESYDPTDLREAFHKTNESLEEKFPLGVLYQVSRPAFHEEVSHLPADISLGMRPAFTQLEALIKQFV
ncbi:2-oxoacid ferredoxin oxidoreductase [Candidatus Roizmanbacteria bacterium]|nr:2-oxoacid ferredoxin oxidoreductase [Candidatus Roizmanbacteria bacterium]